MTEHDLQNEIRLELSKRGYIIFRANVGKVHTADGRWFDTGLPVGFSDTFAVKDGKVYFIEVKKHPKTPSEDQKKFIARMIQQGCRAGVAYSLEEALQICNSSM